MSIWVQGRQKDGGRARYSVGVPFEALFVLAAIVCSVWVGAFVHSPDAFCTGALGCLALGLVLIAAAKVSLFRQGIWHSWGAGLMTRPFAVSYVLGYAIMATGTVMLLLRVALASLS